MNEIEFLTNYEITEYIDSWRLISAENNFNTVLTYLNLTEFQNINENEIKNLNKIIYLNLFLEYSKEINPNDENNNATVTGTIVCKKNALSFLQIIIKVIDDLIALNKKTGIDVIFNTVDFQTYITHTRNKNEYSDQLIDDQTLINRNSYKHLLMFVKLRDILIEKTPDILSNSSIYLTIDILDF